MSSTEGIIYPKYHVGMETCMATEQTVFEAYLGMEKSPSHVRSPTDFDKGSSPPKKCLCGCGKAVTAKNERFAKGHRKMWAEQQLKRLCVCGCGGEIDIKPHYASYGIPKYIHGHQNRSKAHRKRMSVNNPMKNKEVVNKVSKTLTGHTYDGRSCKKDGCDEMHPDKTGENSIAYKKLKGKTYEEIMGEERAEELKRVRSRQFKKNWEDPESRVNTEEFRRNLRKHTHDMWDNLELRRRLSESMKKAWADPNSRYNTKEFRERALRSLRGVWETVEGREKIGKSRDLKPNKPERLLIDLFNKNNLLIWYCGDFVYWIGRKNPDFKIHGQNKVIEFAGKYWHTEEEMEERTKLFKGKGFDCLVIWDTELKDLNKILTRVTLFVEAEV